MFVTSLIASQSCFQLLLPRECRWNNFSLEALFFNSSSMHSSLGEARWTQKNTSFLYTIFYEKLFYQMLYKNNFSFTCEVALRNWRKRITLLVKLNCRLKKGWRCNWTNWWIPRETFYYSTSACPCSCQRWSFQLCKSMMYFHPKAPWQCCHFILIYSLITCRHY